MQSDKNANVLGLASLIGFGALLTVWIAAAPPNPDSPNPHRATIPQQPLPQQPDAPRTARASLAELREDVVPTLEQGAAAAEGEPVAQSAWDTTSASFRSSVIGALSRHGGYHLARTPSTDELDELESVYDSLGTEVNAAIRASTHRVSAILEERLARGSGFETYDLPTDDGPTGQASRRSPARQEMISQAMKPLAPAERISVQFFGEKIFVVRVYPGDDRELDELQTKAHRLEKDLAHAYSSILASALTTK